MASSKIVDSPVGWVQDHIRAYIESNGEEGHIWRGVPTLLLTTTGRKSGTLRRTALIYGRDGDDYVIVASKGGDPKNPLWYENLATNSKATLQVGADVSIVLRQHTKIRELTPRIAKKSGKQWLKFGQVSPNIKSKLNAIFLLCACRGSVNCLFSGFEK